jgi:hypothetical protein
LRPLSHPIAPLPKAEPETVRERGPPAQWLDHIA